MVQGSRIARIDPTAQGITYELRRLTVMPGWIDTHAHIVQHFDRKTGKTPARGSETLQRRIATGSAAATSTMPASRSWRKAIPIGIDTFKRALACNIPIVFGTDAVAGASGRNYEEFIYRVRDGGQKPMAAIVAASTAAQSLDLGDKIDTIAPGFEAEIIATDGNPLQDITAVRRVVFVMKVESTQ